MSAHRSMNALLESLLAAMGITPDQARRRQEYVGLERRDLEALQGIRAMLVDLHPRVMEEFYAELQGFDELQPLLADPAERGRVHRAQWSYLAGLAGADYDWDYVLQRLRVGAVHQCAGVEPQWYLGGYARYLSGVITRLAESPDLSREQLASAAAALTKVGLFDIGLVLESYFHADRLALQALKTYAESMVCNVPAGLLVLDAGLEVVSANRFMEQVTGRSHDQLAGEPLGALLGDDALVEQARQAMDEEAPRRGIPLDGPRGGHYEVTIISMDHGGAGDALTARARLLMVLEDLTEKRRLRHASRESDARLQAIMDNIAEGVITIDECGTIESFNPAAERLFGYPAADVVGADVTTLMPAAYRDEHDGHVQRYIRSGAGDCVDAGAREVEGLRSDGTVFPMELTVSQMRLNGSCRFIGIVRDVTERKRAELNAAQLSSAVEQTADAVIITDVHGRIEYVNSGFEATTGYTREEAVGRTPRIVKSGVMEPEFYGRLWSTIADGAVFRDVFVNRRKNGELYYEEKTITPLRNERGEITHFVSTGKDITDRRRTEEQLQYLAHHDVLTGLPNRRLFMDRLSQAMAWDKRHGNIVALLFMDLDSFKMVNDGLGHDMGDRLLKEVARRLVGSLREADTVARLSGDEFAVILPEIASPDDAARIAAKLIHVVSRPALLAEGVEMTISASVGIALFPTDGVDVRELLRQADIAMYNAKSRGRGGFQFFTAAMNSRLEMRFLLEHDLRKAVDRGELFLEYQPQVDVSSGRLVAVEALLRWEHAEHGRVSPARFVPILEDTGLIREVGAWVVRAGCRQLALWRRRGLDVPRVAVNISPRQLEGEGLRQVLLRVLAENNLDPGSVELEITESLLMENESLTVEVLGDLNRAGVRLAMDDFGTGYSSLSYLRHFPIHTLKIDRSFVANVPGEPYACELARAIIAMGQSLGLQVVAEGVETADQRAFLARQGCPVIQGYLVARPMGPDDFEQCLGRPAVG